MKYCQHCGAQISDNAEFCPNCGNSIKEENIGGSYVAGFFLGFLFSIIGLIIGLLWEGKTKEGAKNGFLASLLIQIFLVIIGFILIYCSIIYVDWSKIMPIQS